MGFRDVVEADVVWLLRESPDSVLVSYTDAGTPPVTSTAYGVMEYQDELRLGDDGRAEVVGRARTVVVPTAGFGERVATDAAVTVDGTAYRVNRPMAEEDGMLTRLFLRRAS